MDYSELVKDLRYCSSGDEPCESCKRIDAIACEPILMSEAADAIEELEAAVEREKTYTQFWEDAANNCKAQYKELLHAAKKMHTWIFLHSYDEQEAYNECGLSDEMNAALGYGGQFEIAVPKEETE